MWAARLSVKSSHRPDPALALRVDSHDTEGVLSDWLNLLGALLTAFGLAVVAPEALGTAIRRTTMCMRHAVRWTHGWLSRLVPLITPPRVAQPPPAPPRFTDSAIGWATVTITEPLQPITTEERIRELERQAAQLRSEVNGLHDGQQKVRADLSARLDTMKAELDVVQRALREQEAQQRKLNSKGFPLAALGLLPGALPAAWVDGWAGWFMLAPLAAFLIVGVRWLWDARDDIAGGWREVQVA